MAHDDDVRGIRGRRPATGEVLPALLLVYRVGGVGAPSRAGGTVRRAAARLPLRQAPANEALRAGRALPRVPSQVRGGEPAAQEDAVGERARPGGGGTGRRSGGARFPVPCPVQRRLLARGLRGELPN